MHFLRVRMSALVTIVTFTYWYFCLPLEAYTEYSCLWCWCLQRSLVTGKKNRWSTYWLHGDFLLLFVNENILLCFILLLRWIESAPIIIIILLWLFTVLSLAIIITVVFVQSLTHALLCHPMDCSTPGFPVLHHLLELAQTLVHCVDDDIQPFHPS